VLPGGVEREINIHGGDDEPIGATLSPPFGEDGNW